MRTTSALLALGGFVAAASIGTGAWPAGAGADRAGRPASPAATTARAPQWWQAGRDPAARVEPLAMVSLSYLTGVYCTGRSDCWAVGLRLTGAGAVVNQMLHWNGRAWSAVRVPNPGGTKAEANNVPAAVRCTTARNCWAVGYDSSGNGSRNEMLHWNGRTWYAVRTPEPAGTGPTSRNILTDVTCISAGNCWATGYFGKAKSSTLNQVLHWNGKAWSRVRVPEPGGTGKQADSRLLSVRCPAPSRCLAVGSDTKNASGGAELNQAQTWTGRSWTGQRVPEPGRGATRDDMLAGLGCGARNSCFAVGLAGFSGDKIFNVVLHWNGRSWSRQYPPQQAGTGTGDENNLTWVTCTSARNCWAVGAAGRGGSTEFKRNQALHWNGKRWVLVHTPNPAFATKDADVLMSVRCTDAANCWAVGGWNHGNNVHNEILRWNGKKWAVWPPAKPAVSN